MKRGILSDPFQCKPEMTFFKVNFLFHMIYLQVHYERVYIKSAVLLANDHQSDLKKTLQMIFRINYRYVLVHAKRLLQWNARKCSIKEDFNQNDSGLSIS